jgi:hypothetical protein
LQYPIIKGGTTVDRHGMGYDRLQKMSNRAMVKSKTQVG